jgi:hypothetical protein
MGSVFEYAGITKCDIRHLPCCLGVALAMILGLLGGQKCYSQGDPELLRLVADGYEANLERLRTWRGTAIRRVERAPSQSSDGNMPLGFKEEIAEQLKFVADRDKDAALWYGTLLKPVLQSSESKPRSSRVNSGMNKGNYHYQMDAMREPESDPRTKRILLAYSKDAVSHGLQVEEFDPVWVLVQDLGASGTMGEALRSCAQSIENKTPAPEGAGYKLERKGDVVTIEIYGPSEGGGISRSSYVFDLSRGCSLVGQHNIDSHSEHHWELAYEEHNGVFVPTEISRLTRNKDGALRHHIVFTTQMVNEPVSESEFSYEALGLRPGDYVVDHMLGGLKYQWKLATEVTDEAVAGSGDVPRLQQTKNSIDSGGKTERRVLPSPAEGVVATAQSTQQTRVPLVLVGLGVSGIAAITVLVVIVVKLKGKDRRAQIR